ncbi:MAG: c-type cytochrome [Bacteroidia bacterium]|nr:c-type cytochrome [Bacteroidia bacterium]
MKKLFLSVIVFSFIFGLSRCRKAELFPESDFDERLSGGSQTTFDFTSQAFSHAFVGLSAHDVGIHDLGDAEFEQSFVTAPALFFGGLGPAFNNTSCVSCHHNDGKGVPSAGFVESSLLVRISTDGTDQHGGSLPVPGYGTQIQDKAIQGKVKEAQVNIVYSYQTYTFSDGEQYELRTPTYVLTDLHVPINVPYYLSPRLAPPVFGLGLLENIPESDIVANADIIDTDGDGISGKPNYVWEPTMNSVMLGRFGHKSNTATILTQVAAAYNNDMGVTSNVFKNETTHGQSQTDLLQDDPEVPDSVLHAVKFYVQTLQVPARRNVTQADVIRGKELFDQAKCSSCHVSNFRTNVNVAFPAMSNQLIHPYTDLLVHDMGEGLSDHRPDFRADGSEWRTAPLWGVGLLETVNYPAYYLHDGRARTLVEAVMWHGGEAEISVDFVKQLSTVDRKALFAFLKSL